MRYCGEEKKEYRRPTLPCCKELGLGLECCRLVMTVLVVENLINLWS